MESLSGFRWGKGMKVPSGQISTVSLQSIQSNNYNREILMTNKELIQQLYENFAVGDVPAVLSAFAENIEWTESDGFPLAGTYVGPDAVLNNVFMKLGEFSENWGVEVERLIADGDTVVADGRYTWNHKTTGEPCAVRMAHIWTFTDGKVTKFLQHVDSATVKELIG